MILLGGCAAQMLIGVTSATVASSGLRMAFVGILSSVALVFWLVKTRYRTRLEVTKYILALGLLVLTGSTTGFGLWSAYNAGLEEPVDNAADAAAAERAKKEYLQLLSSEVVRSDQTLGLATLKAALSLTPGRNMIVFPPGLAQILHMDVILGDHKRGEEICRAAGINSFPQNLTELDKAIRELIVHPDPGVHMKWATSIELAPQSAVVPSARLQQLSKEYCGHGIMQNQALKPDESIFITTALFDGRWLHKFDHGSTSQGVFFTPDHPHRVDFMHQKFIDHVYFYEDRAATVVGLPYKNNQQIAYIVLPNRGNTLQRLIGAMLPEQLLQMTNSGHPTEGTLALPKLSIESSDSLNQILGSMGVSHIFERNDLPKLADSGESHAVWIKQKVKISLDEEGTKVETLIAQLNETTAAEAEPQPPFNLTVDRPFLLAIKDLPTEEWLFLGAIFDPSGSSSRSVDKDLERLAH